MTLNKLSLYVDNFIYYVDGSLHQNITSSTPFGLFDIYLENLNNDVTSSLNINIEECEVSRSIRYNNALEIVKKNFKDLFNDQSYIFSTYPSEYNISRNIFDSFTKCNLDFSQLEQDIPYSLIVKLKNNIEDYQYGYNEFLVSEMNSNSDIRNGIKKYNNTFGSIFDNVFLNSFDIYLELGDEENNGWNKIYNNKNNNNNFYKLINIIKRSNQVLEISKVYEFTNL